MYVVLGSSISQKMRDTFNQNAAKDGLKVLPSSLGMFGSGEPFSELFFEDAPENFEANKARLAGQPVTIVQSTAEPVGDHVMQLLLAIRTLKRYGAGDITVAMPFAAFARQDRAFEGRFASVAAEDLPFLLRQAGATRIVTSEVHSKAAEKFYTEYFDENNVLFLSSTVLFRDYLKANFNVQSLAVGAPDGADKPNDAGQRRAADLHTQLFEHGINLRPNKLFKIWKAHTGVSTTKILKFEGDVAGKTAVIVDDMVDSGGTLKNAAKTLKQNGATDVVCALTHAILTGNSLEGLITEKTENGDYAIDQLVLTDTIPDVEQKIQTLAGKYPNIRQRVKVLSTAEQYYNVVRQHNAKGMRP